MRWGAQSIPSYDRPDLGVAAGFSNLPNELIERDKCAHIMASSGKPPFRRSRSDSNLFFDRVHDRRFHDGCNRCSNLSAGSSGAWLGHLLSFSPFEDSPVEF